ncbi:FAD-binding oxidoreductase [Fibrella forsythiae]|uniref:FAD-binding oxidoreductase n=1 Tax=Fibrella forsythiae TaxID=2817061 RepID=A0ABS3JG72_9BACT|nr:FAD-binding oxidoreductase [Fibrella forsythiae]MBO0948980.1 FAD-binding oxidoreductase [Fibrella forsythiae]
MQKTLLTIALLTTITTTAFTQAPTVAAPNSLPKKAPVKTDKTPTMVMRIKKKTASHTATTQKKTTSREIPDTYKGRILTVGSGGGVVGKEKAYLLLDDGRLFSRQSGQKTYTFVGQQTADNTKKVFWSVEDRCAIRKTAYNKPGNIYRFVNWKKGAVQHKVAWAPGDKQLPPNYEQVYSGFMGMIPAAYR